MTKISSGTDQEFPLLLPLLAAVQHRLGSEIRSYAEVTTPARAAVLIALDAGSVAVPTRTVAANVHIGQSSLSGLIDRMVRDGLVIRQADPDDRRAYDLVLTEEGRTQRAEALRATRELNACLCQGFDAVELAHVARWLEAIAQRFPKDAKLLVSQKAGI